MRIQLKILDHAKDFYMKYKRMAGMCEFDDYLNLPTYAKPGDAGMDLRITEDVALMPGETRLLPTGIAIWIGSEEYNKNQRDGHVGPWDQGVMGMIVPRSGLGTKGLVLANTIGILDEGYQGEILISAWNRNPHKHKNGYRNTDQRFELKAGDRIAQLVFTPVIKVQWQVVEEFGNESERGENGFGHSGSR